MVNINKKLIFASLLLLCVNLLCLLSREYLSEEQSAHSAPASPAKVLTLANLYAETGITEYGLRTLVDQFGLCNDEDLFRLLREYQDYYHAPVETTCERIAGISCEDFVLPEMRSPLLPIVEDGDILITFAAHTGTWRNGHAALVIDATNHKTIESTALGTDSCIQNLSKWRRYPNYYVLRLTDRYRTPELISNIITYAKINLINLPYNFLVGIHPSKSNSITSVIGTQCSHLVWQAYAKYGIDLDSDGGMLCTPKDLLYSPYLTTVQVYGVS